MARRQPPQPCPVIIPTGDIVATTRKDIEKLQTVRDNLIKTIDCKTATFGTVVQPIIDADHSIEANLGVIAMLRYAAPEEATRKASEEAVQLYDESSARFTARSDLYVLLRAVKDKGETLDGESQKYLDRLLGDYVRCGNGKLSPDGVAEYVASRNAVDRLRRQFTRNIRDDASGMWFTARELDGLPQEDLVRFRKAGVERETPEEDAEFFVSFTKHDVAAVLKHATEASVRKRLYVADINKLVRNVDVFKEAIVLRDKNARMLGYSSHAAFRIERRVAKTVEWVDNFLDELETALLPQGQQELNELLAIQAAHSSSTLSNRDTELKILTPWDYPFYKRLAQQAVCIEHEKISEYFPIENTVHRMLDLFSDCLQLQFDQLPPSAYSTWAPHVDAWAVWDERPDTRGEFIGYLYMDLMFRPNKHRGCQNVNLLPSYVDVNGERIYPATLLMCNFPSSASSTSSCTLLKHHELVSLFHELGHGIHDLVARTKYSIFHGWRSPPDYAEAPSMMLENWVWIKDELKKMSCHYTSLDPAWLQEWEAQHPGSTPPPATVPDALIDPLIENRNVFRALYTLDQLAVARFDMQVHSPSSHAACQALNPTTLYTDLLERLTLLTIPDPNDRGHPHCHFGHLLSGYDAGYFSYLSAQVFAADMFETCFAEKPRDRAQWARYRKLVLERGGSGDELGYLHEFLGRAPRADALMRAFQS